MRDHCGLGLINYWASLVWLQIHPHYSTIKHKKQKPLTNIYSIFYQSKNIFFLLFVHQILIERVLSCYKILFHWVQAYLTRYISSLKLKILLKFNFIISSVDFN